MEPTQLFPNGDNEPNRYNAYDWPDIWSEMSIGDVWVPGIIESIDGAEKPQRWIVQMGMIVSGGWTIWRGQKIAESIKVVSRLYDRASFNAVFDFRDTLLPKPGCKPPALIALNGAMNFVGITRVSVVNITPPHIAEGLTWRFGFELTEYNPPKTEAVGPQDPPKSKTEADQVADQIEKAQAEAAKLGDPGSFFASLFK